MLFFVVKSQENWLTCKTVSIFLQKPEKLFLMFVVPLELCVLSAMPLSLRASYYAQVTSLIT